MKTFHRRASALLLPLALAAPALAAENRTAGTVIEETLKQFTLYAARFAEGATALVIVLAVVRALIAYFANLAHAGNAVVPKDAIRLSLGRSLALALEFALGADILKTAVAPSWNDIGQLAAIAVLRTGLNYFLERELRDAEGRDPGAPRRTESA